MTDNNSREIAVGAKGVVEFRALLVLRSGEIGNETTVLAKARPLQYKLVHSFNMPLLKVWHLKPGPRAHLTTNSSAGLLLLVWLVVRDSRGP